MSSCVSSNVDTLAAQLSTQVKESLVSENHINDRPLTVLVGAGVVGTAIANSCMRAGLPFVLVDQRQSQLRVAVEELRREFAATQTWELRTHGITLQDVAAISESLDYNSPGDHPKAKSAVDLDRLGPQVHFLPVNRAVTSSQPPIIIESISERLEIKQDFFRLAQSIFGSSAVYCSNTSNLQIRQIARGLDFPDRLCGMHFFMPVHSRSAVEIATGLSTDRETIQQAILQVKRLNKQPLRVSDSPGFIVNRLLSPYLNEAMLLLCRGVSSEIIQRAARRYGMPISPLELIDWIGTRTAFDAGRVFWRAFPKRLCPAPLLPALVKNQRRGRFDGGGFYDYSEGMRSDGLSTDAEELIKHYQTAQLQLTEQEVLMLLAVPMWIEATLARLDGVIHSTSELDLAMRGGLGFESELSWSTFFDQIGSRSILKAIDKWASLTPAMDAPQFVMNRLRSMSPSQVIDLGRQRPAHVA